MSPHIFPKLCYIGIAKRFHLQRNLLMSQSHLPNHFSYLASNNKAQGCFPYDYNKSMWGTLLNLKHVLKNPFHDHDFNGKWFHLKSVSVYTVYFLTWRHVVVKKTVPKHNRCIERGNWPFTCAHPFLYIVEN